MPLQLKSLFIGFCLAPLLLVAGFFVLYLMDTHDKPQLFHEVRLTGDRTIKMTMCNLSWGEEHGQRFPDQDGFSIEYVAANPKADVEIRSKEAWEVFELIRATAEGLRINGVSIAAFPALARKGQYDLFLFQRDQSGKWTVARQEAKVFVND